MRNIDEPSKRDMLKAGDEVVFRNGGVDKVVYKHKRLYIGNLEVSCWSGELYWTSSGYETGFDIIKIVVL